MKRHRSPGSVGEGSSRAKLPKTASASTETGAEPEQLLENYQNLHISVTLGSATKAARNDPRPPLTGEEKHRIFRECLDSDLTRATEYTADPRGTEPTCGSSAAADLGLADGQHSAGPAQHCRPVESAPTANSTQLSREASLERSKKDDDSGLDDSHSHKTDANDEGSEDEVDSEDEFDSQDEDDNEDENGSDHLDGLWDCDFDDGLPWYEEINGRATLSPSTDIAITSRREACRAKRTIGSCSAKLIRRSKMRESFWLEMEIPIQETHDLAFDLFDRYGRLNSEFYEHPVNKGTGVWGKELDWGDLLLFEELSVDSAHRRRGIGTKLVNAILERTRKKVDEEEGFFALAGPGFLWSEISHLEDNTVAMRKAQNDAEKGALSFWHAMGFRRVGTSSWLAWTDSPDHPSRQLGIAQDWLPPGDLTADITLSGEMEQIFQRLADPAFEAAECIDQLTNALPDDFEDGQWKTSDKYGNTLLHIAAQSSKSELVSFLTSVMPGLMVVRNKEGHTPLEALLSQLERQRTRRSNGHRSWVVSDEFQGFSDSSIACRAVLEQTAVFNLSSLSPLDIEAIVSATDERIRLVPPQFDIASIRKMLRYKYGCTCGQCIGGFLSPRTKYALLCVAEVQHDNMDTFMDYGPEWVAFNEDLLKHLPGSVMENLKTNKSMRQGFSNMCDHFAKCMEQGRIPSEGGVLDFLRMRVSEWPPVTRNFLQRGGNVAAAANMIFETAMEQDEWAGDGFHREVFEEDIDKLVACRNDHEFGFVAGICGYKRVRPASSRFVDSSGRELDPPPLD